MRNCVVQRKEDKTVVTPHYRGDHFNLQLVESLFKFGVVRDPFPAKWKTSSDRKVHSANPRLDGREFFYSRLAAGRARGFLKGCRHARPPQPSLVWTPYVRPLFGTNLLLVLN